MTRILVFASVALLGLGLRFGADWVWWADLVWILFTALVVAATDHEETPA